METIHRLIMIFLLNVGWHHEKIKTKTQAFFKVAILVVACFGTILFGIAVELIIKHRRLIVAKIKDRKQKIASSALLYAIQLTFAYGIMLIIMTYSGPLVLCVIIGLVAGHILCSLGENDPKISSGSTPCCSTDEIGGDRDDEHEVTIINASDEESLESGNCCTWKKLTKWAVTSIIVSVQHNNLYH